MFFKYNSKLLIETISYGTQSQTHALWSEDGVLGVVEMYSRDQALQIGGYHGHCRRRCGTGRSGRLISRLTSDQSYSRTQAMRIFSWNDGFVASDSLRTSS